MARAQIPEEFLEIVAHHRPPEPPVGPKGGRPRVAHRIVLRVIWFVLTTGCRGEDVPPERGGSGRTAHRRLRAFGGGEATGPSPVDRSRKGTKPTLLVDRHGVPLAVRTAGAKASDHRPIIPLILDFPRVGGQPGRPKEWPDEAYADRGFDSEGTRELLRWLGIEPPIAKWRTPHGRGLGQVRWVVERMISWLKGLRRMRVRYDRLGVIIDAWTTLAASVIGFRILYNETV